MKKYILSIIILLACIRLYPQAFKDIKPNESFQYGSSNGAYFVSPDVIYDYGLAEVNGSPKNAVIRTTNAGLKWNKYLIGMHKYMVFYGLDTIITSNYNSIFWTFNDYISYDSVIFAKINEISKGNEYIYLRGSLYSKDSTLIYRSKDYGKTWKKITDKPLEHIVFVNDSVGYARYGDPVTTMWIHAKTTDNGLTWEKIPNSIYGREYFEGVAYELYPDGYYLGEGFQKSIDEGRTWTPINNGIPDDAQFGISTTDPFRLWKFINPTTGFFYEHQYGLFKTIDGGQNWIPIWNDYKLYINDMHIIYDNKKVYFFLCTNNSASYNMYYGVFDSLDIWNSIDTETPLKNKIRVFPNPAKEEVNIQTSGFFNMNTSIRVYDAAGKQVLETKLQIPQTTIDISGLDKGIYFLKILNGDGEFVEKLIKD